MFIDASAAVAVLARESDREEIIGKIVEAQTPLSVSPLVRLETVLALARIKRPEVRNEDQSREIVEQCNDLFDKLIDRIKAEEIAISTEIGRIAVTTYARYGKGFGRPAKLNLVDCFSYACAKSLGAELLYKGDDFAKTDLK